MPREKAWRYDTFVKGNDRTRAYVIEGLQKAYQAKTLGTVVSSLEEAMFGLQQLGHFEEIHFEMDDVEADEWNELLFDGSSDDATLVDLNITVRERNESLVQKSWLSLTSNPPQNRRQQFL